LVGWATFLAIFSQTHLVTLFLRRWKCLAALAEHNSQIWKKYSGDMAKEQGDQIGRIFASCATVFLEQFLKIAEVTQTIWAPFFNCQKLCINLGKIKAGLHYGQFIHNLIWPPCQRVFASALGILKRVDRLIELCEGCSQGDQIGRIFAQWAIVHFGQFFENYTSSPHF
jgi:hypothetical protein